VRFGELGGVICPRKEESSVGFTAVRKVCEDQARARDVTGGQQIAAASHQRLDLIARE
jgi:hypothetical protein